MTESMTTPPTVGGDGGTRQSSPDAEVRSLGALAVRAAETAGSALKAHFGGRHEVTAKRSPTDLVSDADRLAESTIVDLLLRERPLDGVIAEEGSRRSNQSGISWVIDPLDGTTNYLYGDHEWAVSIAALDRQGPLVAVVLAPMSGRLFTATRGVGAFEGETRLTCSSTRSLDRALVLAGLDYDSSTRAHQMELFAEFAPRVRDLRRHGSAALELCRVAEGSADVYLESPIQWWDIAAGALIAAEAGAVVSIDVLGGSTRSIYACAAWLDSELRAWLAARDSATNFGFLQAAGDGQHPEEGSA